MLKRLLTIAGIGLSIVASEAGWAVRAAPDVGHPDATWVQKVDDDQDDRDDRDTRHRGRDEQRDRDRNSDDRDRS